MRHRPGRCWRDGRLFTTRLGTPTGNPITPVIKLSTNLTRASRACPTSLTMTNFAPLTERRYVAPFILITSLFFLWAFGVNLNDILIPRFKNAFASSDFQSSFIQVALFSGYCLAALPAGRLLEKIGYKRGILTGLALCASGALLFVPASVVGTYAFFLVALFVRVFLK
jgi:FHS family L-fucose permease-like MFS transporter